jgi:hypothetical protein
MPCDNDDCSCPIRARFCCAVRVAEGIRGLTMDGRFAGVIACCGASDEADEEAREEDEPELVRGAGGGSGGALDALQQSHAHT